jgi:DUF4097 and DUF4098 domain-containing protein YvlB
MKTLLLLAVTCTVLFGNGFIRNDAGEDWNWRGAVPRGRSLEIRGITGDIRAVPANTGEIEVTATIDEKEAPSTVELRVSEGPRGVTICPIRKGLEGCPEDPLTGPPVRVDFRVRVPEGVHFVARTVNGGILADSLSSDIEATTVNGSVVLSTSGTAQARTVNGSIRAHLSRPFWTRPPEFSAVNGGITLDIPTNVHAALRAETKNGKVVSDVAGFHGTATEQAMHGSIGGGSASPLVLRTINGTIELKQRF